MSVFAAVNGEVASEKERRGEAAACQLSPHAAARRRSTRRVGMGGAVHRNHVALSLSPARRLATTFFFCVRCFFSSFPYSILYCPRRLFAIRIARYGASYGLFFARHAPGVLAASLGGYVGENRLESSEVFQYSRQCFFFRGLCSLADSGLPHLLLQNKLENTLRMSCESFWFYMKNPQKKIMHPQTTASRLPNTSADGCLTHLQMAA